jgi:hypothetical protein
MQPESANNGRRKVLRLSLAGPFYVALVAAFLLVMQTSAAAAIFVRIAPPVPLVEVTPPSPGPNYVWVPGYWVWSGGRYVWRAGAYIIRPHPGALWAPGHWVHTVRGWHWVPGHWR